MLTHIQCGFVDFIQKNESEDDSHDFCSSFLRVADIFLGYYNRTCGSEPPKDVGPSLRGSLAITWRQWVVTIIGENEKEQWGYMETYYPEDKGPR